MSITTEVPKTHPCSIDNCPECKSKNCVHDYDTGETVCGDCGLVLFEQMLDKGPEWRAFTQQEKASEAASVCQHRIQFMTKDYPQPLAKSTETLSEENCQSQPDFSCGA